MQREEEVRRPTGGAPGPGRARKRAGSLGGAPWRAFSRRVGLGPAPCEAAIVAPSRPATSGPRGGERRAGAGRTCRASFPGAPLRAVHVAPVSAVSAGWGLEGVFGEGGSLRDVGASRQRVHFPGNQQQAALFGECCPFN